MAEYSEFMCVRVHAMDMSDNMIIEHGKSPILFTCHIAIHAAIDTGLPYPIRNNIKLKPSRK